MKIFLGGTHSGSQWRDELIEKIGDGVDYHFPSFGEFTIKNMRSEVKARKECDYFLYLITPMKIDPAHLEEAMVSAKISPEKTIFGFMEKDGNKKLSQDLLEALKKLSYKFIENGAMASTDPVTVHQTYMMLRGLKDDL